MRDDFIYETVVKTTGGLLPLMQDVSSNGFELSARTLVHGEVQNISYRLNNMRFISPKTDFAFKKIFGSTDSKDILISFLNAILYGGQPTVKDLDIINPYSASKVTGLKDTYLDVKAKITGDKTVIIEMQVLNVAAFDKRVLYNEANLSLEELDDLEKRVMFLEDQRGAVIKCIRCK